MAVAVNSKENNAPPLVPEGYTRTPVGLIPSEWSLTPLGPVVTITSGESPSLFQFGGAGTPYFKVDQLNNSNKYLGSAETEYFIVGPTKTVPPGSVLFPKRGASIMLNKVRILREPGYLDTNMMALTPLGDLQSEYLFYILSHIHLSSMADVTSIPQINNKHVKPFAVPVPSPPEQCAIAAALSDVDELIGALDKLIVKKRAIKLATMQQLLTGKTRLPGFSEEWHARRFSDVCWFQEGPGVRNSQFTAHGVKLLNGTNIFRGRVDLDTTNRFVSEEQAFGQYRHFLADAGDIVIACSGITIEKFDEKVAVLSNHHLPLCMNTSTMRFKPVESELAPGFLLQFLMSSDFKNQIGGKATGSAQLNFGPSHVAKVSLNLPSIVEQEAITRVLSDMDAEIAILEQRHDKTKAIKQGMMQSLLTGRVRLVEPEGTP